MNGIANEWVRVSLQVPPAIYGDFLEFAGRFISGRIQADGLAIIDEPSEEPINWLTADRDDDLESAIYVYGQLSERARGLFDLLMDNPGKRFTGDELAEILGIPNGRFGTAGTLAWPGRHSQTVGRKLPVHWDRDSHEYWMKSEIGAIFQEAREAQDSSG